ncbi:hypothetical protein [Sodalis sp. dw_96]|uniref:hypothetical protein n=1 Tax=Sodalis sp. dw_96 TaxID=2719794 RepID=UPI001BD4D1B8|nr:hypothetical protein [Sodalis sp. dw_96]
MVTGVLSALIAFIHTISRHVHVVLKLRADRKTVSYLIHGTLFFAISHGLREHFIIAQDSATVEINLTHASVWVAGSIAALTILRDKYKNMMSAKLLFIK